MIVYINGDIDFTKELLEPIMGEEVIIHKVDHYPYMVRFGPHIYICEANLTEPMKAYITDLEIHVNYKLIILKIVSKNIQHKTLTLIDIYPTEGVSDELIKEIREKYIIKPLKEAAKIYQFGVEGK